MGIAQKLNTGRKHTVREGIDTAGLEYLKADEVSEMNPDFPLPLAGFFLKDGDYGKQVTLIVDDGKAVFGINVAKRYTEMFEDLTDDEIEDVKAGKLGISSITPNVKTPKGKTTVIEFVDID